MRRRRPWLLLLAMTLLASAHSLYPKVRSKRYARSVKCPSSEYAPSGRDYCCNKCTRGHYVKTVCAGPGLRTICAPCRNETYLAAENSLKKCKACTVCDPVLNQMELETCHAYADRRCGCPKNTFKRYLDETTFNCQNCTRCRTETIKACSENSDTICPCEENKFYHYDKKDCLPCDSCSTEYQCAQCKGQRPFVLLSIVSCSIVLLMVTSGAGYLLYRRRKRGCHCPVFSRASRADPFRSDVKGSTPERCHSPDQLLPIQEEGAGRPSILTPSRLTELPDCVQVAGTGQLLDDTQLSYVVADVVPASRWRELVRRLGLPDAQIERAEMEARPSFREAQYQMFQLWRQRQGGAAPLQLVFRTLRDMDLNACAEQLHERLQ